MKSIVAAIGLLLVSTVSLQAQDVALANANTIRVKLDNARVRVMEATLAPGVRENPHSHPSSVVYVLAGGRVRNHLLDGTTSEVTYTAGETLYRDPVAHWAENIGTSVIRLVVVELKPDTMLLQSAPVGGGTYPSTRGSLGANATTFGSASRDNIADAAAVDAALRRYSSLVATLDHNAISALFTPDGEILNPGQPSIRGRAAIDQTLARLTGYQVVQNETTPTSTSVIADSATQTGTFHESIRLPTGRIVDVSGNFKAEWQRQRSGEWLIHRMETSLR